MYKLSLFIIFLFSLLLIQCKGKEAAISSGKEVTTLVASQDDEKTTYQLIWIVASEKSSTNKLWVKHSGATQWKELNKDIINFEYKKGFEYTIKLQKEVFHKNPDLPKYTLLEVLDKKKKKSDLEKPSEQPFFKNTTWNMKEYDGQKVKEGYIRFYNGGIELSVGCNHIGTISVKPNEAKNSIKFNTKSAVTTCMACLDKGITERENNVLDLLSSVTSYEAAPSVLKLKSGEKVVMVLKR